MIWHVVLNRIFVAPPSEYEKQQIPCAPSESMVTTAGAACDVSLRLLKIFGRTKPVQGHEEPAYFVGDNEFECA